MKKIIAAFTLVFISQQLMADAAAEIKYRAGVMEVVGGHMHSMVAILKGRTHMNDLDAHAKAMANIALIVPTIFPEGSGEGKTEALAKIWEQPEEFKKAMDKFVNAANGFANATSSGDMSAVGPAIKELGGSCKGCHDDFKKK